ncbi:MAG: acetylxylan esterase [Bacteroidales bacterium]|jgi:hypothetical protein|nr:acetylxylan esterase [Bacteroidales bacterium]
MNLAMQTKGLLILIAIITILVSCTDVPEVNYDDNKIPNYNLPELLIAENGDKIKDFASWYDYRRPEVLDLFASEVYGAFPSGNYLISFSEEILTESYLDGKATVKEITAEVTTSKGSNSFSILYIYPNELKNAAVFVGLNFGGNHTVDTLSSISVHSSWIQNNDKRNIKDNRASADSRGASSSRWPLSTIIEHGYGVATVYYGEIDPDFDDGFKNGFHPLFASEDGTRDKHSAATISMWAKGMSFIADYLLQDSIADPNRIIAIGHSRLGKTALWSGANDERFAAVISNNSGCGGAALSMREIGETVARINTVFPHWFCDQFKTYNKRVKKLPVDQHMLLALMAPRPVYVASASNDQWADPKGEFMALKAAIPVYALIPGYKSSFPEIQPDPEKPIHDKTGYHLRSGKHDITEYDWVNYMNWADKWLGK